jgi:hypothetical protein
MHSTHSEYCCTNVPELILEVELYTGKTARANWTNTSRSSRYAGKRFLWSGGTGNTFKFPVLATMAKDFFAIQASNVAVEEVFSAGVDVAIANWNRLSPKEHPNMPTFEVLDETGHH